MPLAVCAFPGNEAFGGSLRAALNADAAELLWRHCPDGESYVRFVRSGGGSDLAIVCSLDDPDRKTLPLLFAAHTAAACNDRRGGLVPAAVLAIHRGS